MHNQPHTLEAREKISITKTGIPAMWKRRKTMVENGITLYQCSKCRGFYSYDSFYKNKRTILGITSECRKCHCQTSIYSRDKENHRVKNREFMRKAINNNRDKYRELWKNRVKPDPIKSKSRCMLNKAVIKGEITKPTVCSKCGATTRITAHHADYEKPLDVVWLCYLCHAELSRVISFERCEKPQEEN